MAAILQQEPCPKCGGQLYLDKDFAGRFKNCIQCGYLKDLPYNDKPNFTMPLTQAKGIK